MIILPSLHSFVRTRPHSSPFDSRYLIPDETKHAQFWKELYEQLYATSPKNFISEDFEQYMSDTYSYFGERMHPVTFEPKYFHMGIELNFKERHEVRPLFDGVLEYSGFGVVNGYYVLLSHPQIQTEDGYVLHTMYCHLKKPLVQFSSYQKMLREISLNSYPIVEVSKDTLLGFSGKSGLTNAGGTQLYLQCDFRKDGEHPIVVNPLAFFSKDSDRENRSKDYLHKEDFTKNN